MLTSGSPTMGLSQRPTGTQSVHQGPQLFRQRHLPEGEEEQWVAVGAEGTQVGCRGRSSTHLVQRRLLQPPVCGAETAQGQLGQGSGFGQRREGPAQLGEEGRKGLAQGQGWIWVAGTDYGMGGVVTCPCWTQR